MSDVLHGDTSERRTSLLRQGADLLTTLTPRRVIQISQILIAIHLALRAIVFGSGFFYGDDYLFQGRAARLGLFSETFLLYEHDGHLMPGGMFLAGLLERLAPLNYWPVLITLLILQWLATWTTYRLLRSLIGPRPALLVPVALLTLTPMTLLPGSWFAAALNFLPMQIAAATAGWAALRAARGRSPGWYVVAAGCVVFGLLFFEKSVLIPVTVLAVVVAGSPMKKSWWQTIAAAIRRTWLVWVLLVPMILIYLVIYFDRSSGVDTQLVDTSAIVIMLTNTVVRGLIPALLGGPLNWFGVGAGTAAADPSVWITIITILVLMTVAIYGLIQSARTRAVWIIAALYITADLTAMAIGRGGGEVIAELGLTLRYTVDSLIVLLVAITVTIAAPLGQDESLRSRHTRRRIRSLVDTRPATVLAAPVLAIAFTAASISSHVNLVAPLSDNPSREWLTNIVRTIAAEPSRIHILDTPVPDFVLTDLTAPYNLSSWVLAPLADTIEVVDAIVEPVMFTESGELVPAEVVGVDSSAGPNGVCGWGVKTEPVSISLTGDPFYWYYTMRISYLAASDMSIDVTWGEGPTTTVELQEGAADVFISLEGGGPIVTVTPTQTEFGVCISQVRVGVLTPAP